MAMSPLPTAQPKLRDNSAKQQLSCSKQLSAHLTKITLIFPITADELPLVFNPLPIAWSDLQLPLSGPHQHPMCV